jgi:hypothetical protein
MPERLTQTGAPVQFWKSRLPWSAHIEKEINGDASTGHVVESRLSSHHRHHTHIYVEQKIQRMVFLTYPNPNPFAYLLSRSMNTVRDQTKLDGRCVHVHVVHEHVYITCTRICSSSSDMMSTMTQIGRIQCCLSAFPHWACAQLRSCSHTCTCIRSRQMSLAIVAP